MTAALFAAAALAAGYALGRIRPAHRASDWAHWLPYSTPPVTRRNYRFWLAQPVYAAEIARMFVTGPRRTVHLWRHRNDPPPPLGPPLRVDHDWAARRAERQSHDDA
jgi:hypothetical protein